MAVAAVRPKDFHFAVSTHWIGERGVVRPSGRGARRSEDVASLGAEFEKPCPLVVHVFLHMRE
jgi:hypothetical protein